MTVFLRRVRKSQQQESDERQGDLDAYGILRCAEEFPDPQRLLDPAEEQLDLPSLLIEIGDDLGRRRQIVGDQTQRLSGLDHDVDLAQIAPIEGMRAGVVQAVAGALLQEAVDFAVILNALRALSPSQTWVGPRLPGSSVRALQRQHQDMGPSLNRLWAIADALDDTSPTGATALIAEADRLVARAVVEHEREDETSVYPRLGKLLKDGHGLSAMSRARSCIKPDCWHELRRVLRQPTPTAT